MCKYERPTSRLLKVIVRQAELTEIIKHTTLQELNNNYCIVPYCSHTLHHVIITESTAALNIHSISCYFTSTANNEYYAFLFQIGSLYHRSVQSILLFH